MKLSPDDSSLPRDEWEATLRDLAGFVQEQATVAGRATPFESADILRTPLGGLARTHQRTDAANTPTRSRVSDEDLEHELLTSEGEELVDAVNSFLDKIGFIVKERGAGPGFKHEDLRVHDPDGSWVALVEIKSYDSSDGKPRDLAQLARYVGMYMGELGAPPSASWYIVNRHQPSSPATHQPLMFQYDEDVDEFADEQNGVLIDTRDLAVLNRRVAAGSLSSRSARQLLMKARRRLDVSAGDTR